MASITIRNLDETIKTRLRVRAAKHGHSMEKEARDILIRALIAQPVSKPEYGLGSKIHALFAPLGGFEIPPRDKSPVRDPPKFD